MTRAPRTGSGVDGRRDGGRVSSAGRNRPERDVTRRTDEVPARGAGGVSARGREVNPGPTWASAARLPGHGGPLVPAGRSQQARHPQRPMSTTPAADGLRTRESFGPEPSPERLDALLHEFSAQPPGPRRAALRDHVIRLMLPMARRVTRRFQRHGEEFDDLVQVAALGLIKAVDGYDPSRGHAFLAYALPKVTGEVRRHLRDRTAAVRLPRPLQDASGRILRAVEELEQRPGGRSPTAEQIAEHTGLSRDRVLCALRAVRECRARSLDEPAGSDRRDPPVRTVGAEDPALGRVVDSVTLAALVRQLPERDRRVLYLRFYRECSQPQIARAVGVSQMQVSRILRRCLDRLREGLEAGEPCVDGRAGARPPAPPSHGHRTAADAAHRGTGRPARLTLPGAAPPLTAAARPLPHGGAPGPTPRRAPLSPPGPRTTAAAARPAGTLRAAHAAPRTAPPLTSTAHRHPHGDESEPTRQQPHTPCGPRGAVRRTPPAPRRTGAGGRVGRTPRAPRRQGCGGGYRPVRWCSAGPRGRVAPGPGRRTGAGPVPARCPRRTARPPPVRARTGEAPPLPRPRPSRPPRPARTPGPRADGGAHREASPAPAPARMALAGRPGPGTARP